MIALLLAASLLAPATRFPADAGVIDVTRPPYNARGDGKSDDTAAIQKALDDYPNAGAIIYLPKGTYLLRDTLRWGKGPRGGMEQKNTILEGDGPDATVLLLPDNCPGFTEPRKPRPLLWTGQKPAQRFRNAVRNLTLHTGRGNTGAIGAQFMANNQGTFRDVVIRSGDGTGRFGLDLGYSDENGPCLIKNVRIIGFEVGIRCAFAVNSLTLEHITIDGPTRAGLLNEGQVVSIRNLRYKGQPPAIINGRAPSLLTLIDSELACTGTGDVKNPALTNEGCLFVRNLKTTGFSRAILSGKEGITGPDVDEFVTHGPTVLGGMQKTSLRLPIKETPEVPWDALEQWAGPFQHGLAPKSREGKKPPDATRAIQAAIDSGKTTVYLPRGDWFVSDTIVLRKNVRRLLGCEARLIVPKEFANSGKPLFRVEQGAGGPIIIERMRGSYGPAPAVFVEQACKRPVVLRHLITYGKKAYRNTGGGPLYLEDVCGDEWEFGKHEVWARQLNAENTGTHVLNDGGRLWVLGYKTERGGTLLHTRRRGQSEILGGFAYATSGPKKEPMFLIEDSSVSVTMRETCFNRNPFQTIIEELRDGTTRRLEGKAFPRWTNGALIGLFVSAP